MRSLAVAIMVGTLVGCSGGLAATDFASQVREATCELRTRCGQFPDVASCEQYFRLGDNGSITTAIDRGVITYDGDKAEQCVNALRDEPCDQTSIEARTLPAACNDAIKGTIAIGGMCGDSTECESRACATPSCGQACCAGTCVAQPVESRLGGPCATVECAQGLVCDNTKTCVELYAAGTPCQFSSDCGYGLACAGNPGICKTAPKLGEPCPDGSCAELGVYCSVAGTCTAEGLTGVACTTNAQCSPYFPCDTTTMACRANPILGQHCTGLCSDGSYCDSATTTCIAPLANGGTCLTDSQCATHYCDVTQNPKVCADQMVCL